MIRTLSCPDVDALALASAVRIAGPHVAISGGGTYAQLFPRWIGRSELCGVSFFPADERLVPIDDPASNWGQARRLLFDPLGRSSDLDHFARSAEQYGRLLRAKLGDPVRFDSVFLGVGEDGHTASLFPGGAELADERSPVLETLSPQPPARRVTLGLATLWAARSLIAVASGAAKRSVVQRLLDGDRSLPITLALAGHPAPLLILERSADPGESG